MPTLTKGQIDAEADRRARADGKVSGKEFFDMRNAIRAEAGMPPEKHKRGGLAGAYDRNKSWAVPALSIIAGLVPGLNAISYPQGVPANETASTLAGRTDASILLQLTPPDASRAKRFRPYIEGLSPNSALQSGSGYFISLPAPKTVTLPSRE